MQSIARLLALVGVILALPVTVLAQEATIAGTVTDSTSAVLPGTTITATHQASGNTFVAVADERGAFRIPVRIGMYQLTAELPGFATVNRTFDLQVGQQAVINIQMSPSTIQESVTVSGEAPLVETTKSSLGSNVDARQMQELPLNGRNWTNLAMLAEGSRQVASSDLPAPGTGTFQVNLDGQQVTQINSPTFGQPRYSRDSIAEFEFIANRFDATQGRSSGVQVNAVTKSGTNNFAGTFSSYFRDSRFNAADFIQKRVLPYSDQQISGTFGGPIRKDRAHFFANYEYEREPQTFTYSTPYPKLNVDIADTHHLYMGGARLDFQFSSATHLTARYAKYTDLLPCDPRYCGGATITPAAAQTSNRYSNDINVALTQVLSNRAVNELRGGFNGLNSVQKSRVQWAGGNPALKGTGAPEIILNGLIIGSNYPNSPITLNQHSYSLRDNLSYSLNKTGRHDIKAGGELLSMRFLNYLCASCIGIIDAQGGPIPANIQDFFPDILNPATWRLANLSPITRTYTQGIGKFEVPNRRDVFASWLQDNWTPAGRITLNLGLRYDLATGMFAEDVDLPPFLKAGRPLDKNNFAPRLGASWSLNQRTVLRGGVGKYYGEVTDIGALFVHVFSQVFQPNILNDGRPDFTANPFNGPIPSFDDIIRQWQAGLITRRIQVGVPAGDSVTPYSWQTSIGLQRQLASTMAVNADYVFVGARRDGVTRNANVSYNPATGANYPFTDVAHKPFPQFAEVNTVFTDGWNDYHALQSGFTKRFSKRWQAQGTYTVSRTYQGDPPPVDTFAGCKYPWSGPGNCSSPITVTPDLGGNSYWTHWTSRAVLNGIWDVGYGFQLSGLYFYRNGVAIQSSWGGDLRQTGATGTPGSPVGRLRANGTIVPRNNLPTQPLHRVDMRLQKQFRLGSTARVAGLLELFNAFNHANYGSYVTTEVSRNYGQPSFNGDIAYAPREMQLGFRLEF